MFTCRRLALPTLLALLALGMLAAPAVAGPADAARLAVKQERWADAADAWIEVLDKSPADKEAAMGLAHAVEKGGLVDLYIQAEEALQNVLEKKPKDRDARLALGNLFLAQARSKTDQNAMKFIYEDAKTQFTKLLEADPRDEDAAVGLARAHYWTAYFSDAIQVLDEFLKGGASKGPALYWKGQVFYIQAQDAYRAAGEINEDVKGLFRKAMASYEQATRANPKYFDAWMQFAYAAQYIGDVESAEKAYEQAIGLDEESVMPLKGIQALYQHRPDEYGPRLEELSHKCPLNRAVLLYLGYHHLGKEEWDAAVAQLEKYVRMSKTPQAAWSGLGQAYEGQGKVDKALEAYRKALKVNPNDAKARGALETKILQEHGTELATPAAAKALLADYEKLIEIAPSNLWIRNNAALLVRNGIESHKGDAKWEPLLDPVIEQYVEAARLAERELQGREQSLPDAWRYKYAGVMNDTGLMFQYFPSHRDLEKAEEYYLRALELTGDGHRDAWNNLRLIYLEQGRWQECYDLCRDCAERLTTEDGSAHPDRAAAAQEADRLVREGRVTED